MSKKIMLVDDAPTANFIMKKMIQKINKGYQVIDFTSPEDAINSIKENNPDLIFLDLNMPHVNGWQFLDLMNDNNFENKVYILSSSTNQAEMEQSKQYKNVIAFLVKPVNLKALSDLLTDECSNRTSEIDI